MKRAILIAVLLICCLFVCSGKSWGVHVDFHTMTLNPDMGEYCEYPFPDYTFYDYHRTAYSWFYYTNATIGEPVRWIWHDPSGDFYLRQENTYNYTSGCWWAGINISNDTPEYRPGNWSVDVYFEEGSFFTEYFTIEATKTTTTTTTTPSGPCPMSLIYGTDSQETELLRSIRDNVLSKSQEGQELIKLYYQWSPLIVKAMEADEEFKQEVKEIVDGVLEMVE